MGASDRLWVDGFATLSSGLLRLRLAEGLVPTADSQWTWLQMLNSEYPNLASDLPWVLEAALPGGGFVLLADNAGLRDGFGMFPQPLQVVLEGGELRLLPRQLIFLYNGHYDSPLSTCYSSALRQFLWTGMPCSIMSARNSSS